MIDSLKYFAVENEKVARGFIKKVSPDKNQSELELYPLNKKTSGEEILEILKPLKKGHSVGILSDAGMPCIADPGAKLVHLAHSQGIKVEPLIGPSSIFLALASSGLTGQKFQFSGYLPIKIGELKKDIQKLERNSLKENCTQIFMETPYRTPDVFKAILDNCHPETSVCVAANITLENSFIKTMEVGEWKRNKTSIDKVPTIFLLKA